MVNPKSDMPPSVIRRTVLRINALARAVGFDLTDVVVIMAIEPPGVSLAALEAITHIPRRTLRRHLHGLVDAGFVARAGRMWVRTALLEEATEQFYAFIDQPEKLTAEFALWVEEQQRRVL